MAETPELTSVVYRHSHSLELILRLRTLLLFLPRVLGVLRE